MTQDKLSAFQTLYTCLETVAKLMAPIAPFYADMLYSDLTEVTGRDNVVSVHLAKFPEYKEEMIDKELEARMQMAQDVTSMVLALRRKADIKVRQPLYTAWIPITNEDMERRLNAVKHLIEAEVNVKSLILMSSNTIGMIIKRVKCDYKKMGPKFGKLMKSIAIAVEELSQEEILKFESERKYSLKINDTVAVIELSDVEILTEDAPGMLTMTNGNLTVG